jgi:thioesterase domain-containing protein
MCSYNLVVAGYSFGGTVAYEMASDLKRSNETVAMVFMIDTYAWFPKALTNCSEYLRKGAVENMKSAETFVVNLHTHYLLISV